MFQKLFCTFRPCLAMSYVTLSKYQHNSNTWLLSIVEPQNINKKINIVGITNMYNTCYAVKCIFTTNYSAVFLSFIIYFYCSNSLTLKPFNSVLVKNDKYIYGVIVFYLLFIRIAVFSQITKCLALYNEYLHKLDSYNLNDTSCIYICKVITSYS